MPPLSQKINWCLRPKLLKKWLNVIFRPCYYEVLTCECLYIVFAFLVLMCSNSDRERRLIWISIVYPLYWISMGSINVNLFLSRMWFHNITGLSVDKDYVFRVCAENLYGRSDHCEGTETIHTDVPDDVKKKTQLGGKMNIFIWIISLWARKCLYGS